MGKAKQELIDAGWINDRTYSTYNADENGVTNKSLGNTRVYNAWRHMKGRCTSTKVKERQPTYIGVTASDNFKNFTFFHDWWFEQKGYDLPNIELDKDLLIKGNKIYSPDTCLLVPSFINRFLVKCGTLRGSCLIGVHKQGKYKNEDTKYQAMVREHDYLTGKTKNKHLGHFRSELEAFNAYKFAKEAIAKRHADYLQGKVDERVIQALLDFEVNIDD